MLDIHIKNVYILRKGCKKLNSKKIRLVKEIGFQHFFQTLKTKGFIMAQEALPKQTFSIEYFPTDRHGDPAAVQSPQITIDKPELASIEVDPENPNKVIVTTIAPGVATITYTADADLDEGEVRPITDFTAIEIKPEEAVGFNTQQVSTPTDVSPLPDVPPVPPVPTPQPPVDDTPTTPDVPSGPVPTGF